MDNKLQEGEMVQDIIENGKQVIKFLPPRVLSVWDIWLQNYAEYMNNLFTWQYVWNYNKKWHGR